MLGGAWLSILPTVALVAGLFAVRRRLDPETRTGLALAVGCLGIFGLAVFHHFITLPAFSAAKAFWPSPSRASARLSNTFAEPG